MNAGARGVSQRRGCVGVSREQEHTADALERAAEGVGLVEIAVDGLDAVGQRGAPRVADQGSDPFSAAERGGHDLDAEIAGRSGDQDHARPYLIRARSVADTERLGDCLAQ